MDLNRLSTGEKIAGAAGALLLLFMFILNWFTLEGAGDLGGLSAWSAFSFIDIILFLAAVTGIALAVVAASQTRVDLPVALSAITAGMGILATLLIIFRLIITPGFEGFGVEVDTNRSIGVFLGLIAAAALAYGGWTAMQEEGTSFGAETDRVGGGGPRDPGGPGAAPSPPPTGTGGTAPPPPSPPPTGTGGTGGPAV